MSDQSIRQKFQELIISFYKKNHLAYFEKLDFLVIIFYDFGVTTNV